MKRGVEEWSGVSGGAEASRPGFDPGGGLSVAAAG